MNFIIPYLKLLYQSTYLPLQYYINGSCQLKLPYIADTFDFSASFSIPLLNSEKQVNYLITKEFLYFGCIKCTATDERIVVGPVCSTRVKFSDLPRILQDSMISPSQKDAVWNFFQSTPTFSHDQFLHLIALINYTVNQEFIDPISTFEYNEPSTRNMINKRHSTNMYQVKEDENFHNSYQFEQELYHHVESGNIAAIQQLKHKMGNIVPGFIGENSLRQEKNLFIASITLLTRHSIAGGLDIETAYQLSDTYIQEAEKAQSLQTVNQLSYTALLDFTNRVAANQIPQGMSPDIFKCIQFISTHTNQHISVGDIADSVGKSQSYISKKFKKELGFNISDFIMRKKLEEAKSLLTYTDKPLWEISEYLCFSTQSYFQNVFKKQFHITPYEYRKSTQ